MSLYDAYNLRFSPAHVSAEVRSLFGVVRLADKYLIEPLQKRLIKQFCDNWPKTLHDWDVQRAEVMAVANILPPSGHRVVDPFSDLVPEPASAIVFAQEFCCPAILPAAFYRLLSIDITDDWSCRDSAVDRHNLSLNSRLAKWGLLDKDNLMRYLHGLREVDRYDPHIKMFMSDGCWPFDEESQASGTPCLLYVQRMINLVREGRARRDPIFWLADCMEHDLFPALSKEYFPEGLCAECRKVLYRAVPRERQRIWGELPKWFHLE